jgi:predicted RNA polymerase sigma factor
MVTLGHAVAVAMAQGPRAALALLEPLNTDSRLSGHHRMHAVRAHLLEWPVITRPPYPATGGPHA